MARRAPPELVISDRLMPVVDGFTLLRQWQLDGRLQPIPVVVYTATYIDPRDEQLALNLGADAFIVKPAEPVLLREYSEALVRKLEDKALQRDASKRIEEVLPAQMARHFLAVLRDACNSRAVRSAEAVAPVPDAGPRNYVITFVPLLDEQGEIRESLGITHDFTWHGLPLLLRHRLCQIGGTCDQSRRRRSPR